MRSRLGLFASIAALTFASAGGIAVATDTYGQPKQAAVDVYEFAGAPQTAPPAPPQAAPPSSAPTGGTGDQGQVLGARAARLTGQARFGKRTIRVGQQTTLSVTLRNVGNGASGNGLVCVRISTALVVVKLPKGVTNTGTKLCTKRSALKAAGKPSAITVRGSAMTISGIVVRGVRPTRAALVRDGQRDGVALTGDRLQVVSAPSRRGGVTG